MLSTLTGALVLGGPAVVLGAMTFLTGAPMEWARGALIAYLAVVLAGILGQEAQSLGTALFLLGLLLAFGALVLGGPTGLWVLALLAGAILVIGLVGGGLSVHPLLPSLCSAAALGAALRHFWA